MGIEKIDIYYDPEKQHWEGCIGTDQPKSTFFKIKNEKLTFKKMATDEMENCANQLLTYINKLSSLEKNIMWDRFNLTYEYFDKEYDIHSVEVQYEEFIFYFRYRKDVPWKITNVYIESVKTSTKTLNNIELLGVEYTLEEKFRDAIVDKLKEKSKHRLRLLNWK